MYKHFYRIYICFCIYTKLGLVLWMYAEHTHVGHVFTELMCLYYIHIEQGICMYVAYIQNTFRTQAQARHGDCRTQWRRCPPQRWLCYGAGEGRNAGLYRPVATVKTRLKESYMKARLELARRYECDPANIWDKFLWSSEAKIQSGLCGTKVARSMAPLTPSQQWSLMLIMLWRYCSSSGARHQNLTENGWSKAQGGITRKPTCNLQSAKNWGTRKARIKNEGDGCEETKPKSGS